MYWFLVMRADLGARRGDVGVVKGRTIGAAPWVEMGLRRLLIEAGIDLRARPGHDRPGAGRRAEGGMVNFGMTAAKALEDGLIDGFWANGMGTEIAVRRGVGTVVLDVRRGDGPKPCFNYTMSALATTDRLIARRPEVAAAAVRAMVKTQTALQGRCRAAPPRSDANCSRRHEAALIADLIRRDLPYYDAVDLARICRWHEPIRPRYRDFAGQPALRENRRHPIRRTLEGSDARPTLLSPLGSPATP